MALSACATGDRGHIEGASSDGAALPDGSGADGLDASVLLPDGGASVAPSPVINEFVVDHVAADQCEYVEVFGSVDQDYGAYRVLVVEGDTGASPGPGTIDRILAVGSTDAHGLWTSQLFASQLENGTGSILLVSGFVGDLGTDLDEDDDGVLDHEPWDALADQVAIDDGGAGDLTYAMAAHLGASFDQRNAMVGGASRMPDGADTDSAADWVRNDFDGEGLSCASGVAQPGEALNTPGAPNAVAGT